MRRMHFSSSEDDSAVPDPPKEAPRRTTRKKAQGVVAMVGGCTVGLSLGYVYSFGNLAPYIVSYMHGYVDNTVTNATVLWIVALTAIGQGVFMPLGGAIHARVGARVTCLLGCSTLSAGVVMTKYTITKSLPLVCVTYGFMGGLGLAIAYTTPMACAMKWYPKRKGFAAGVVVGGFGLGSLVASYMMTLFINPDNLKANHNGLFTQPSLLAKVPDVFLLMGGVFFCIQLLGIAMLSEPEEEENSGEEDLDELGTKEFTWTQTLRTVLFYKILVIFLCNTCVLAYVSSTYKSFGLSFFDDDFFMATVASLSAIFNGVGRVVWGAVYDRTNFSVTMCVMSLLMGGLAGTFPLSRHLSKAAFAAWVWSLMFVFGGQYSVVPAVVGRNFGQRNMQANYSMMFVVSALALVVLTVANMYLLPRFGYVNLYHCMPAVSVVGLLTALFLIPNNV